MNCTREEYLEFHEDPARDNAETRTIEESLVCNACGQRFEPTEPTMQKDEWCLCESCAEAIEGFKAGKI